MAKRRRYNAPAKRAGGYTVKDILTGGTGDVNPQYMTIGFVPIAPGTTESRGYITSLNRQPQRGGQSSVMEILKVYMQFPVIPDIAAAPETSFQVAMALSTQDHGNADVDMSANDVLCYHQKHFQGAFTAAGTYGYVDNDVICYDYTDGQGHGILVATDTLYLQIRGGATWATSGYMKILYRMKNVPLTEYIGIVQSQQ